MKTGKSFYSMLGVLVICFAATGISGAQTVTQKSFQDSSIRKFEYHATDQQLSDLKRRISATKWPDAELVDDDAQGVQLATMQSLAAYWTHKYDWRVIENKLNAVAQFITNIDGVDIHFIHIKSKHKNVLPIIITHGWPGSIIEQLKVIEPLTDPTSFGGKAEDAFDVVIPSIPGYGFSGKPRDKGWTPKRIAQAWITLMHRLGYSKYVAQGGDWGNAISENMALIAPDGLLAIHTNMPATLPANINHALQSGSAAPSGLAADELSAYHQLDFFFKKGLGYASEMSLRPQTLYGIEDSPIGLAGWMLDHDAKSYQLFARVFDGKTEGLTRDDILDNITLYWLTNTAVSSARLYWETAQNSTSGFFDPRDLKIPVAVSAFPDELYTAPKAWAVAAYPKLIYFNKLEKGGHFAAWEQPEIFTEELRAAFRSVR